MALIWVWAASFFIQLSGSTLGKRVEYGPFAWLLKPIWDPGETLVSWLWLSLPRQLGTYKELTSECRISLFLSVSISLSISLSQDFVDRWGHDSKGTKEVCGRRRRYYWWLKPMEMLKQSMSVYFMIIPQSILLTLDFFFQGQIKKGNQLRWILYYYRQLELLIGLAVSRWPFPSQLCFHLSVKWRERVSIAH